MMELADRADAGIYRRPRGRLVLAHLLAAALLAILAGHFLRSGFRSHPSLALIYSCGPVTEFIDGRSAGYFASDRCWEVAKWRSGLAATTLSLMVGLWVGRTVMVKRERRAWPFTAAFIALSAVAFVADAVIFWRPNLW